VPVDAPKGGFRSVRAAWYRGEGVADWTDDNFGDGPMNRALLPALFPGLRDDVPDPSHCLLGIGSLLGLWHELAAVPPGARLLVFGSGFQYGQPRPLPSGSRVFCVRGRLSAETLGLPAEAGVADPAVLLPRFFPRDREARPGRRGRFHKWNYGRSPLASVRPAALAHAALGLARRARLAWSARLGEDGAGLAVYASRTGGAFEGFLRRIWSCERIETDAFHVAVAADAYGIPWRPLRWEFKWQDHFAMLGLAGRPQGFVVSDRTLVAEAQATLVRRAADLRSFVDGGGSAA
jgi:succinoglycan biosynthesis protein ExoV